MNNDIDIIADRLESKTLARAGDSRAQRSPAESQKTAAERKNRALEYERGKTELLPKKDVRDFMLILDRIKPYKLDEVVEWRLMTLPFDVNNDKLLMLFLAYVEECFVIKVEELSKPFYEEYYQKINLYYSFSKAMNLTLDEKWKHNARKHICEEINALYKRMADLNPKNMTLPARRNSLRCSCKTSCYEKMVR